MKVEGSPAKLQIKGIKKNENFPYARTKLSVVQYTSYKSL
jgi:hypothetical protein